MQLYCGIDLHGNNSLVSIINDQDQLEYEKRLPNDFPTLLKALQSYKRDLVAIVRLDYSHTGLSREWLTG